MRHALDTYPEHPSQAADGGSEVGHDARLHSTQVRRECGAAVESEPAEPEEHRAKHDVGRVVGLVREALSAVSTALTEVDGDCKRGGSGRDVDGSSTGEVEAAKDEGPAVGVPRPAGDGVVYDGRPDEDENHNRTKTTALSNSTDGEHGTVSGVR